MKAQRIVHELEQLAPTRDAESWDNVGLLVGDPNREVRHVMVTVDYTDAVAEEAKAAGCEFVLAYHPPIFRGLTRIPHDGVVADAIRRGVCIYSIHTAFDVADGGTNDLLANLLGMTERRPLRKAEGHTPTFKLVTFVPENYVGPVSDALFSAGAGRIGGYTNCSFRQIGTATFLGEEGTEPSVGMQGKLETTAEVRFETVVAASDVERAVGALRRSHPYEEPAFDLVPLAGPPTTRGLGRIGRVPRTTRLDFVDGVRRSLGLAHLLVAGPVGGEVERVAVCAGSCGDLIHTAIAERADVYVTGEVRHHDALAAAARGMTVVCALHSNSERFAVAALGETIARRLPEVIVHTSTADRDPFRIVGCPCAPVASE